MRFSDGRGGNVSRSPAADDVDLDNELRFHNVLYKVVVPVTFGVIIGVGVCGNALVVYVTLTCRAMRTTVNLLLLNLAASDVLFLLVAVPFIGDKTPASPVDAFSPSRFLPGTRS